MAKTKIKICWLGRKHRHKYVCFIPFTIDGMGKTIPQALENLEKETVKIIRSLKSSNQKIKCNFTEKMVRSAIRKKSWWNLPKSKNGKRIDLVEMNHASQ